MWWKKHSAKLSLSLIPPQTICNHILYLHTFWSLKWTFLNIFINVDQIIIKSLISGFQGEFVQYHIVNKKPIYSMPFPHVTPVVSLDPLLHTGIRLNIFHRSELDRKFDNTELTVGVFVRSQTETETVWSKVHLVERRGGVWRWREERGSWMRQRPEDRDEWLWMWMCGQSAGKQAGERSWSATKTRISYGVSASVTERLQQCC